MTERQPSLPVGFTWAPRLEGIRDGQLNEGVPWIKRRAPRELLTRFINIAESPDTERAVRMFTRKWGLLGLCGHGVPRSHNPACDSAPETVDAYKSFSLCLASLRRVGLDINAGSVGNDLDWELADTVLCAGNFPPWDAAMRSLIRSSNATARNSFQTLMRVLVTVSSVQPRFCWTGNAWSIDFDCHHGSNLPAILTVQLMAQIGGRAMKKCRNCTTWFEPRGRQVYCASCGLRAARRDAAAAWRRRQKDFSGNLRDKGKKRASNSGKGK